MMLRLLTICLVGLCLLYAVKVGLVFVSAPPGSEPDVGDDGVANSAGAAAKLGLLGTGYTAWRNGEDAKAIELFKQCMAEAADASQLAACRTALGEMSLTGSGVPANLSQATALFEQSAEVGDPDAQFNLGIMYAATHVPGDDLQHREALAVLHLYAASTAGHPGALMAMGYRHLHGYGVPQACATAALNYIDVAKRIASVYSEGMPQAVELIRLNLNQKDRKTISSSEMNLFVQIATSGDTTVAAAIGKRYLLGIEGFKQDYGKAKHYLRLAASRNHAGALALLGYMHCLGLGMAQNLDTAYSYFVSAATQNDPLGHNGLGFIYFTGTSAQARNLRLAFRHFNESAFGGSSDGMFNLASMYLTGTGIEQSFNKAVLFYTQALDRGHTPAAYSLAVMHLNGIGTIRDCDIAVNLLKKVCERGEWVSSKLVDAYDYGERQPDKAALLFLKLAEAGHEVAQMNAAHIFDAGQSSLLFPGGGESALDQAPSDDVRHHSRTLAQRYYELSAEQGSASSELRLGDYAYNGWGVSAAFKDDGTVSEAVLDELTTTEDGLTLPTLYTSSEVELNAQPVDYEAAIARYRKTADMTVTGEWMQGFVARGSFNLGFMYQFGLGVAQDLQTAKQHYQRCREVDPSGLQVPVTLVLLALGAHMTFLRLPPWPVLLERIFSDVRAHMLVLHLAAIAALLVLGRRFVRERTSRARRSTSEGASAGVEGRDR
mmetsp:Transcript_96161/g.276251  ORF Transcript_96161/g.276251 Transcript_96161/m.276251 type:complete len:717 (-) Transcript_96161:43-2193(-)